MRIYSFVVVAVSLISLVFISSVSAQQITYYPAERVEARVEQRNGGYAMNLANEKQERKEKLQDLKDQMQSLRKERQASASAARAEFREKLAALKDQKKARRVESIDQRINAMNATHAAHLAEVLDKLDNALIRIDSQASKAGAIAKPEYIEARASAEASIQKARDLVASQGAKIYTFPIASDSAVRATVGQTIREFRSDLNIVRGAVREARQAVQNVIRVLASLRGTR